MSTKKDLLKQIDEVSKRVSKEIENREILADCIQYLTESRLLADVGVIGSGINSEVALMISIKLGWVNGVLYANKRLTD